MIGSKTKALWLGAAMILCVSLLAPAMAQAYCVYNDTNVKLQVCGELCSGCLSAIVDPGGHACCPGDDRGCRGTTLISFSITYPDDTGCGGWSSHHKVDAHGWVSIRGSVHATWRQCLDDPAKAGENLTVTVYHSDGSIAWQGPAPRHSAGCMK